MRGFAVFFLRLSSEATAVRDDFGGSGDNVCDLEANSRPCPFPLTATVDADGGTSDSEFGNMAVSADKFRAKNRLIESCRALQVRCPDDIFDALDGHLSVSENFIFLEEALDFGLRSFH